jgi:hypothetical protein
MYLTHLVPTAWLPGVLARADAHAFVKFTFVFSLTTLITLMTYHYFVRSTVIGGLLNGRRYPRALPGGVGLGQSTVVGRWSESKSESE